MKAVTFQEIVNIPELDEAVEQYPMYGPFWRGEGAPLAAKILSPETFLALRVVTTELELPAVSGIARWCAEHPVNTNYKESFVHSAIGGLVCVLMEANGFKKTHEKKSIGHPAFSKGEVYGH